MFILSVATLGSVQPPLAGRAGARCPGCQMELELALLHQLQSAALGLISHRLWGGSSALASTQMFASRLLLFPDRFWGRGLSKAFGVWFGASQHWGSPLPRLSPAALHPGTSPGPQCHPLASKPSSGGSAQISLRPCRAPVTSAITHSWVGSWHPGMIPAPWHLPTPSWS